MFERWLLIEAQTEEKDVGKNTSMYNTEKGSEWKISSVELSGGDRLDFSGKVVMKTRPTVIPNVG